MRRAQVLVLVQVLEQVLEQVPGLSPLAQQQVRRRAQRGLGREPGLQQVRPGWAPASPQVFSERN